MVRIQKLCLVIAHADVPGDIVFPGGSRSFVQNPVYILLAGVVLPQLRPEDAVGELVVAEALQHETLVIIRQVKVCGQLLLLAGGQVHAVQLIVLAVVVQLALKDPDRAIGAYIFLQLQLLQLVPLQVIDIDIVLRLAGGDVGFVAEYAYIPLAVQLAQGLPLRPVQGYQQQLSLPVQAVYALGGHLHAGDVLLQLLPLPGIYGDAVQGIAVGIVDVVLIYLKALYAEPVISQDHPIALLLLGLVRRQADNPNVRGQVQGAVINGYGIYLLTHRALADKIVGQAVLPNKGATQLLAAAPEYHPVFLEQGAALDHALSVIRFLRRSLDFFLYGPVRRPRRFGLGFPGTAGQSQNRQGQDQGQPGSEGPQFFHGYSSLA